MQAATPSIADEVETAISSSSPQRARETVKRVTDLFSSSAHPLEDSQIELFGAVLERLIKTLELRAIADVSFRIALAEMSAQLAPLPLAPKSAICRLAANEDITIAAPVLSESPRLPDEYLVELAKTKSEHHLLAISGRWWLKEVVTDALLARRYPAVSRRIVRNPGARISPIGFATIVAQAASDPDLAVETGIRADLPSDLRDRLLHEATEAVRSRLLSRAPPHLFEEIRRAVMAASKGISREMSKARDFAAAIGTVNLLKANGQLDESALLGFASQRKYEETVVSLAELSHCSIEIIRPLMQSAREDGLLVACKVAALCWETAAKVLECRYVFGSMSPQELARAKELFLRLHRKEAARLLNLWKVRSGVSK
jgi:uncharacterized protein (DUF2336 family)